MFRLRAVACLAGSVLSCFSLAEAAECRDDPEIIGQCFTVHGRVSVGANMLVTLWPVGTTRLLGIDFRPDSDRRKNARPFIPENLGSVLDPGTKVFGDFVVCPFTLDIPGKKRYVCVQSASHLVIQR